jgi:thioredoxin 1
MQARIPERAADFQSGSHYRRIRMTMNDSYAAIEPTRAEIDRIEGPAVIEFGAPWCGYCRAAQPPLAAAFAAHPQVRHIKVEDGKGRPLGRSFRVRLWPTLVFLRDGKETARLVRPDGVDAIRDALAQIDPAA